MSRPLQPVSPPAQRSTTRFSQLGAGWSLGIAALWLAFSRLPARAARRAGRSVCARLWRNARPTAATPEIAALLATVPLRRVELCLSQEVDRPSVIGFFSPRVLIPDWLFAQLSAPELFQIVLHEVEHLRRADDWLNLLQKLSLALFPLNPALVWIERRLCSERELACDDGVLRVTLAPRVYATCLTTLAERRMQHRTAFSLSLGALGASGSELARRVYRILNRQPALSPARARAVTALLAIGLAGCAAELARSPQLVSFAAPAPAERPAQPASWERPSLGSCRPGRTAATRMWSSRPARPPSGRHRATAHDAAEGHDARRFRADLLLPAAREEGASRCADDRTASAFCGHAAADGHDRACVSRDTRPAESMVVMTAWTVETETTSTTSGEPGDSASHHDHDDRGADSRHRSARPRRAGPSPSVRSRRGPANAAPVAPVHQVSPQYAAVPTDLGWLIVQL